MKARHSSTLLPEVLLLGYRNGFFPMAHPTSGRIQWHRPDPRAIIPLNGVHLSRSLRREIRKNTYTITVNTCFDRVIANCAQRPDTWINDEVIEAYSQLHRLGYAHSVEAWYEGSLAGGLYGVAIGGAFFGESMFSTRSNASKVAFARLVYILIRSGFELLDTQYLNDFTASLGAIEIPDEDYQVLLRSSINRNNVQVFG